MTCCASCIDGRECDSPSGLGFLAQDDSISSDTPNNADGSLDALGLDGLTTIIAPTFSGDWSNVDIASLPPEAFGIDSSTLTGLGQFAEAALVGAKFAPSVSQWIEHAFKLGAGRREADIVTPNQNAIFAYMQQQQVLLDVADPLVLRQGVLNLQEAAYNWLTFVSDYRFRDGRASVQSCETLMPLFDGTCGYQLRNIGAGPTMGRNVPVGADTPCMSVSGGGTIRFNAWPHNWGYGAGLLGALRRRLVDAGGALPSAAIVNQGVGVPDLQFPQTNGSMNSIPQAGQNTQRNFLPGTGSYPLTNYGSSDWTSDPMTLGLLAVAAYFIIRR